MSPDRVTKARKLLQKLLDPQVVQLIDRDKLIAAADFNELVDMATLHALDHGDVQYVNNLVAALAGTRHQRLLADWFCSRLGLKPMQKAGRMHLRKDPTVPIAWPPLATVFPTAAGKRDAELLAHAYAEKVARLPVVLVSGKKDMLDSWKRLPGSFGAGKRR